MVKQPSGFTQPHLLKIYLGCAKYNFNKAGSTIQKSTFYHVYLLLFCLTFLMKFNWFCTGNSLLTSWAITWYSWRIPLVSILHIKYSNSESNLIVSGIPLIISHRRLHIVEKLLTSLLASDLTSCPFCFINQAKVIRNYRTANYTLSPVNTNVIKSCTFPFFLLLKIKLQL